MKKVLTLTLCLALTCLLAVNSSYALPDVSSAFQHLIDYLGDALGIPSHSQNGEIDIQIVSGGSEQQLYPGAQAQQTFSIRNNGTSGAYFRFVVAVQYDAETWDQLSVTFDTNDSYLISDWMPTAISDVPYRMKIFTYKHALAADESSPEIMMTVGMDPDMTNEQFSCYGSDFIQMKVLAVETNAFDKKAEADSREPSALDALDRALPLTNFNPF